MNKPVSTNDIANENADLLIELGTEELPPTALRSLSEAFTQGILENLDATELDYRSADVQSFATPRRLAVLIPGLQTQQPDKSVEKLGPAVAAARDADGKPTKAAEGFARSNNISFDQLVEVDTEKGPRLCYRSTESGKATADLLETIIDNALEKLPIPKRMRWGASREEFVRPVHWLLVLLGDTTIHCKLLGVQSTNQSYGHRFHAPQAITIAHPREYQTKLAQQGAVVANFDQRRTMIVEQVRRSASALGGIAVIEDDLLDEVTALVEKPVALAGKFDEAFLAVPQEALIYSMSEHQKYFHIVDNDQRLLPYFIAVSNIDSAEPDKIIQGNEKVIRPRLADAAFFFETDKELSLAVLRERLRPIVFQKKLGTVYEKTERIGVLAEYIATEIGADSGAAKLAGELCKADLASDMVLEFDKMQGTAGGYYAKNDGLPTPVADAIASHYLPRFAGDSVPESDVSCSVALADRLDTLTGIFGIGQEPSGSKDPFALRRASIGILQIILQNQLTLDLRQLIDKATQLHGAIEDKTTATDKVVNYVLSRFAALYQDQGLPAEVFVAIRAKSITDPLDFDARVKAVAAFIKTKDGESLASANKRVGNLLAKTEAGDTLTAFSAEKLVEPAERQLADQIEKQQQAVAPLFAAGNYRDGLLKLTELKSAVDSFFDEVMVNVDDKALKANRLALLNRLRTLFLEVADISVLAVNKK